MKRRLKITAILILFVLFVATAAFWIFLGPAEPSNSPDISWVQYETAPVLDTDAINTRSFYLTMRDGVKIAIDLHLPRDRPADVKSPTIIAATRYMRSVQVRWPLASLARPDERIRRFLANDYAWVNVDCRGSGASFGHRPGPWSPDEIEDLGEVVDWIVEQPWSNGIVGGTGISYGGTTAEMLVTNKNVAVKAVAAEFSLFDAYTDIAFPGGIHLAGFTQKWGQLNAWLDANEASKAAGGGIKGWFVLGVKPVDEDLDGSLLAAAIAGHQYNCNVYNGTKQMSYRDDLWPCDPSLSLESLSPAGYLDDLNSAGTTIYSYSGWFDGAYQNAAISRFLSLEDPNKKLVIGPWCHAGYWNCSPVVDEASNFDHVGELIRFFDHHLKGVDNGIDTEPPIHYYTMVEEKWKSSQDWPPPADRITWYFDGDARLNRTIPRAESETDNYKVRYDTTTGSASRWDTVMTADRVAYPDRRTEDEKLLTYTTEPLDEATEVTGHGTVTLYLASTAPDGQFFAYLEDVTPDGTVRYVTEGELRALHRKISSDEPPYKLIGVYHSFLRKDAALMEVGEISELVINLLPTSYLFEAGHRIRIAIAGADIDHFGTPLEYPPMWTVHRDRVNASRVELPVVRH